MARDCRQGPPGWFWSSEHLLELYVRTLAHERMLAAWIKQTDRSDPRYLDLLGMHRTLVSCG